MVWQALALSHPRTVAPYNGMWRPMSTATEPLALTLNGRQILVDATSPQTTLLDFLALARTHRRQGGMRRR